MGDCPLTVIVVVQTPRSLVAFGVPFVMAVSPTETTADVADRMQKRLCIPNEQFAAWRFKCVDAAACTLICLPVTAAMAASTNFRQFWKYVL
jgi:Ubiquitin-specific protease C-terminal